jgi:gluconolactonase
VSGNSGSGGSSGSSGNGGGDGGSGSGGSSGSGGGSGSSGSGGTSGSSGSGGSSGDGGLDAGPDAGDSGGWTIGDGGAPLDVCEPGAVYGDPLPAPANRTATLIQDGFKFLEGPVWHSRLGVLFFSDMDMANQGPSGVPSKIWKFAPPATFTEFVASSGSNGLALSAADVLLACVHDTQTLALFTTTGVRFDLPLQYMTDTFNSPNDLTERSDGHIYFTDPDWQLPPRAAQIGFTGVYHYPDPGPPTLVDDSLNTPNGIALSPDGDTLYVGSAGNDVMKYDIDGDGLHSNKSVFASPGPSDGFAIDCAGNLYVTTGMKVVVYAPDGMNLGEISVAAAPANAAFGDRDRKTLLITARTGLYRIMLNVPGYPY